MTKNLERIHDLVWGVPTLVMILGIGIYLSFRTGFVQFLLFHALRLFGKKLGKKEHSGDTVSPYQALCTALAATVGTGNLAGVAGAIAIGGPGSIFWMWICALLGMAVKYAEATLAVRYRVRSDNGEFFGGPMYMIRQGMPKKTHWLASVYCFFGVVAAFGVGNATQVNAVVCAADQVLISFGGAQSVSGHLVMGVLLAALIGTMLMGGMKRIGKAAEMLVPFASVLYIVLSLAVLFLCHRAIPEAFQRIFQGAFSPSAVTGGAVGSLIVALRTGVSRGVFTNEAGMGTASIAHAGADVHHPAEQGMMGLIEVFLDTIVICTMTALVILVSGIHIPYGEDTGAALTTHAFANVLGDWVSVVIAFMLALFAIATVLGWGLYGTRCAQFLFGYGAGKRFVLLQAITVVIGAVLETQTVWILSGIVNGLMAIPNLIALAYLSPELVRLTKEYREILAGKRANGGTNEDFYQRKSLPAFAYAKVPSPGGAGSESR